MNTTSHSITMEKIIKLLPLDIHERMKWVLEDIVYNGTITCFTCDNLLRSSFFATP